MVTGKLLGRCNVPGPGPANIAEKTKKLTCMTFRCLIILRNRTVAHSFLLSFVNANDRLCQEQ